MTSEKVNQVKNATDSAACDGCFNRIRGPELKLKRQSVTRLSFKDPELTMLKDNRGTVELPKTPAGPAHINFALPTINRLPSVEPLDSILRKIQLPREGGGGRGPLTSTQITLLQSLKWKLDRGPLLTLDNRALIYEIIGMCEQIGVESSCTYIQDMIDKGENRWTEILFGFRSFASSRDQYQADIIRIRDKIQVSEGLLRCPKCHSMKTSYTQSQTRSADEPMTIIAVCSVCGYNWRS